MPIAKKYLWLAPTLAGSVTFTIGTISLIGRPGASPYWIGVASCLALIFWLIFFFQWWKASRPELPPLRFIPEGIGAEVGPSVEHPGLTNFVVLVNGKFSNSDPGSLYVYGTQCEIRRKFLFVSFKVGDFPEGLINIEDREIHHIYAGWDSISFEGRSIKEDFWISGNFALKTNPSRSYFLRLRIKMMGDHFQTFNIPCERSTE